jgi:hypothetical protein
MPNPKHGEPQEDFISRFMGSPEAVKDFPDQKQRAAVAYSKWRENTGNPILNDDDPDLKEYLKRVMSEPSKPMKNARGQVGTTVPMRFIEPGLVHYDDVGTVLVRKETLDNMLASIVGKPIFNFMHKEVSNDDFDAGKAQGILAGNPRYNPDDGWFWVDGLVWDDETRENAKKGYSLSCAYDVTAWGPGGVHNNIPYDREVLAGEYTHLAIVNNPRYEGARLIINQGGPMKLKFWQKEKSNEPAELELTNSVVEVEGKETKLEEIIAGFKADQERKALENSKIGMDSVIDLDGKKIPVKELVAGYQASLKNADDEKAKKDKEKMDEEERKNAEAKEKEEKEKKDKEDMENAKNEKDHEDDKHKDKPMENCLSCKAESARKNAQHFDDLRNARNRGEGEFREPGIKTSVDRIAEGSKRYGTPTTIN